MSSTCIERISYISLGFSWKSCTGINMMLPQISALVLLQFVAISETNGAVVMGGTLTRQGAEGVGCDLFLLLILQM